MALKLDLLGLGSRLSDSFISFPASGSFCHVLITFADSLDPDQARQTVCDGIAERFF